MTGQLKPIVDTFIYGNVLISLAAASLTWVTGVLLGGLVRLEIILLVFFATLFIYNFDRLLVLRSIAGLKSERHEWIVKNARLLLVLVVISLFCLGYLSLFLSVIQLGYIAHLGIISLLYSIPLIRRDGVMKPLRSIKGLKIFLIAYVWAATTAVLPALNMGYGIIDFHVVLLFIERALFIFAATLPFDIRDYKGDLHSCVVTIPHVVGVRNAKRIAALCILIFMLMSIWHYNREFWMVAARMISGITMLLVIRYADDKKHEYYYTGLIDGLLVVQALLVFGFERLWG